MDILIPIISCLFGAGTVYGVMKGDIMHLREDNKRIQQNIDTLTNKVEKVLIHVAATTGEIPNM